MTLQHEPVITLGARASLAFLKYPVESLPLPVVRTERGGECTYHGPGQLVMYPILDLDAHNTRDLHQFQHMLEQVVIDTLLCLGVHCAGRKPGMSPFFRI